MEEKSKGCLARFGNYLFGEFKEFYKEEKEKDTQTEEMIFAYIKDFIDGEFTGNKKDSVLIHAFEELKKCQKDYPEVLKPDVSKLYRGITLAEKDLQNIKLVNKNSKHNKNAVIGKYNYYGKSKIQSWTPKFELAKKFAKLNKDNKIPVVLEYNFTNKSLLFNTKFLVALSKLAGFKDESEIIRIENKSIITDIHIDKEIIS